MATPSGANGEFDQRERRIAQLIVLSPLKSLWNLQGISIIEVAKRTWKATLEDRLLAIAAELGFWFVFALFPALLCATDILGLAARSANQIYDRLLEYLALIVPASALGMVVNIFRQTTMSSSSGKLTFGLLATVWSASVGVSALQDATNAVYKITDRRSFFEARLQAIELTLLLICTATLCLFFLFAGDFVSVWLHSHMRDVFAAETIIVLIHTCGWILAIAFLALSFSAVYYYAPDLRKRRWHWITPGATLGIAGWFVACIGFRVYLHLFKAYSATYGSFGVFITLLMWFYITGLMLLIGAEFNKELEAAAMELRLLRERPETQTRPDAGRASQ